MVLVLFICTSVHWFMPWVVEVVVEVEVEVDIVIVCVAYAKMYVCMCRVCVEVYILCRALSPPTPTLPDSYAAPSFTSSPLTVITVITPTNINTVIIINHHHLHRSLPSRRVPNICHVNRTAHHHTCHTSSSYRTVIIIIPFTTRTTSSRSS